MCITPSWNRISAGRSKRMHKLSGNCLVQETLHAVRWTQREKTLPALRSHNGDILVKDMNGKVNVSAYMEFEGSQRPLSGELEFETTACPIPGVYSEKDAKIMNKWEKVTEPGNIRSKSEIEKENEILRQQLNEYRIKEVGEQQTLFGKGIND